MWTVGHGNMGGADCEVQFDDQSFPTLWTVARPRSARQTPNARRPHARRETNRQVGKLQAGKRTSGQASRQAGKQASKQASARLGSEQSRRLLGCSHEPSNSKTRAAQLLMGISLKAKDIGSVSPPVTGPIFAMASNPSTRFLLSLKDPRHDFPRLCCWLHTADKPGLSTT